MMQKKKEEVNREQATIMEALHQANEENEL
jgi:hypothetical protein